MSQIRLLDNFILKVDRNGTEEDKTIRFGTWWEVDKLVRLHSNPTYFNIHFSDGSVAYGVSEELVELHSNEIEDEVVQGIPFGTQNKVKSTKLSRTSFVEDPIIIEELE